MLKEKNRESIQVSDSFFDYKFSFCEQSNWVPNCEFLVVDYFQILVLGIGEPQKNIHQRQLFSVAGG